MKPWVIAVLIEDAVTQRNQLGALAQTAKGLFVGLSDSDNSRVLSFQTEDDAQAFMVELTITEKTRNWSNVLTFKPMLVEDFRKVACADLADRYGGGSVKLAKEHDDPIAMLCHFERMLAQLAKKQDEQRADDWAAFRAKYGKPV